MVSEDECVKGIKHCPIETAFEHFGKKWSINIIRDLFLGIKRFKDFLEKNQDISGKMLSKRLKELEQDGLIEKKIVSKTPIIVEYSLTDKGKELDKVLYEVIMFSMKNYSEEVFKIPPQKFNKDSFSRAVKKDLGIH